MTTPATAPAGRAATPRDALLEAITALAHQAGTAILDLSRRPDLAVAGKPDGSPVTAADRAAEAIILAGLARLEPAWPALAEESFDDAAPTSAAGPFWLVDPLDGTRDFVAGSPEYTVNIALVVDGCPVLGVVHAPALGLTYRGLTSHGGAGHGAWLLLAGAAPLPIAARRPPASGAVVLHSRHHGDRAQLARFLEGRHIDGWREIGSSLKLCYIAAGEADLYPRFGSTMEWDIAAGHAILRAAGGEVETAAGEPLRYGKPGFRNPEFMARGLPP